MSSPLNGKCLFRSDAWFVEPMQVCNENGISTGSAVFAQFTVEPTHTWTHTHSPRTICSSIVGVDDAPLVLATAGTSTGTPCTTPTHNIRAVWQQDGIWLRRPWACVGREGRFYTPYAGA